MASRSIEAGKAFIRLAVDDKAFGPGLDNAARKLDAWGKSAIKLGAKIGAAGAALSAPFIASLKIFADVGSSLNDMSVRTGLSVDALSEFKFAAEQTGTSLSDFENGIRRMQRTIGDATTGSAEATQALQAIGVSLNELNGLSPDAQFARISKAIGAIPDPTQRAAAAMEIFGRSGTALLPMIAQSEELREKARQLGLVWSKDMAESADNLGDIMDILKAQFVAVAAAIAEALAPAISRMLEVLSRGVKVLIDFARENKTLVQTAATLAFSLAALGTVIGTVGIAAQGASLAIGGLSLALNVLAKHPYLIAIGLAVTALTAAAGAFFDVGEAAEKANAPIQSHVDLENELSDAVDQGTKKLDARAEALQRLTEAEQSAVAWTERRARLNEVDKLERQFRATARLEEIERRLAAARRANVFERLLDDGRVQTREEGLAKNRQLILELERERARLRGASSLGFSERSQGLFPIGTSAGTMAAFFTRVLGQLPVPSAGRGRGGFGSRPQLLDELAGGRGVLSTFSGRLAPQIFGAGQVDKATKQRDKMIEQHKVEIERLKSIDQKLNLGPGFRAGLA